MDRFEMINCGAQGGLVTQGSAEPRRSRAQSQTVGLLFIPRSTPVPLVQLLLLPLNKRPTSFAAVGRFYLSGGGGGFEPPSASPLPLIYNA